LGNIGGLDVTNLSKGISLFLIERAKQELNIAFFQKFKKFIEKYDEIRILFPKTSNCISNLLAYQYSQMLPNLQVAFYKDMEIIPQNLVELLMTEKYYNEIKNFPEFMVILKSIILLQQINQLAPPDVIESLPKIADDKKFPQLEELHSSLMLVSLFSNSVRTDNTEYDPMIKNYWISPEKFYTCVLNSQTTFTVFLGLIYQEIKKNNIKFNGHRLDSLIKNEESEILWYKLQFSKLLTQVNQISIVSKNIIQIKEKGNRPTNQDICLYVNTTINLFEFGFDIVSHYNSTLKVNKVDSYIELARNVNGLYFNSVSQKYALAMSNAINILNTLNKNSGKKKILNDKLMTGITTYGTFIANIADADSPEKVKEAIDAAALPAGSSSFKKNYSNNIALNAYLGVNAGNWPKDKSPSVTWNGDFRLTAPIGITWTPCSFGKGGSLSLFVPLLDIGAMVDYQLKKDSTSQEINQKIYLANIFSPGGYLVYGMAGNIPISIGFGGQYGPGLIKLGDNLWNPSWRWNFFIAVDIPILNLRKGEGITK